MMKAPPIAVDFSSFGVPKAALAASAKKLQPYLSELGRVAEERDYSHPAASLLLADETHYLAQSMALARHLGRPNLLIVVGIGGSNLGALAVSQAVLGPYHNLLNPNHQLLFADTTDALSVSAVLSLARACRERGGSIILNAVSKSGTTLETQAIFTFLRDALGGLPPSSIVVTSDEGSAFEQQASRAGWYSLPIPKMVGGRYSVFSSAGLFPLMLMGIDAQELLAGASSMREHCLAAAPAKNPAMQMAAGLHYHMGTGRSIHDHFMFSGSLAGAGQWYRQLMAESLGKESGAAGKLRAGAGGKLRAHAGITPTVSIGSTDLHSMVQLYLAGPADKTFCFVHAESFSPDPRVPHDGRLGELVPHAGGRTMGELMGAILAGTQAAFRSRRIPFADISLPSLSPFPMGQLMQMEMVEMMLLAKLMNVNAFDQPAVEEYKKETRKRLAR